MSSTKPEVHNVVYRNDAGAGPIHGHRQHAQKWQRSGRGSGNILADRQTYTQTYSSQYFATAPTGDVINKSWCNTTCCTFAATNERPMNMLNRHSWY